jgi:hypothetical protein
MLRLLRREDWRVGMKDTNFWMRRCFTGAIGTTFFLVLALALLKHFSSNSPLSSMVPEKSPKPAKHLPHSHSHSHSLSLSLSLSLKGQEDQREEEDTETFFFENGWQPVKAPPPLPEKALLTQGMFQTHPEKVYLFLQTSQLSTEGITKVISLIEQSEDFKVKWVAIEALGRAPFWQAQLGLIEVYQSLKRQPQDTQRDRLLEEAMTLLRPGAIHREGIDALYEFLFSVQEDEEAPTRVRAQARWHLAERE